MISDAMTLGELYKERRCELGLSVKEVENATSIRSMYIEAIEAGKTEQLLSAIYIQGFMRQYAIFLDLDLKYLEKEYAESFRKERESEIDRRFDYGLGGIEMREGSVSNSIFKSQNIVWGASFVVVFLTAFLLLKLLGVF